ncbi:GDSL-type esterase/lipase family protein [Oceanobacillus halotolerans]|uniref:GDSL-type esterase/lipase family protein n=1 Tax=Oceanobacillus halotolerans TaxID=2663380 RepID=UPI0013DC36EE|nr:GDSL-type esterase/lipase family protein [Oceanobacillus halotolerans]
MPFIYTALGDSLTVGTGSYFQNGFVPRYKHMLEQHYQVPVRLLKHAKPRITSIELLNFLSNPNVQQAIYESTIITVTIGGNDLLQANKLFSKKRDPYVFNQAYEHFYQNLNSILNDIKSIKSLGNMPYMVQIIGLYNPYPQIPYSDFWVLQFNTAIQSMVSNNVQFIDIQPIFKNYGKKALSFGIHPNKTGYQLIAEGLFTSLVQS